MSDAERNTLADLKERTKNCFIRALACLLQYLYRQYYTGTRRRICITQHYGLKEFVVLMQSPVRFPEAMEARSLGRFPRDSSQPSSLSLGRTLGGGGGGGEREPGEERRRRGRGWAPECLAGWRADVGMEFTAEDPRRESCRNASGLLDRKRER